MTSEIHPMFRESSLIELAERKDESVPTICESLLASQDIEEWFLAVRALSKMATEGSILRLFAICLEVSGQKRKHVLSRIATVLPITMTAFFRKLVRDLIDDQIVDITNWTQAALEVVSAECHRLGIQVVQSQGFIQSDRRVQRKLSFEDNLHMGINIASK